MCSVSQIQGSFWPYNLPEVGSEENYPDPLGGKYPTCSGEEPGNGVVYAQCELLGTQDPAES